MDCYATDPAVLILPQNTPPPPSVTHFTHPVLRSSIAAFNPFQFPKKFCEKKSALQKYMVHLFIFYYGRYEGNGQMVKCAQVAGLNNCLILSPNRKFSGLKKPLKWFVVPSNIAAQRNSNFSLHSPIFRNHFPICSCLLRSYTQAKSMAEDPSLELTYFLYILHSCSYRDPE